MREKIIKAKPFAEVAAHQIEQVFTMTDKTDRLGYRNCGVYVLILVCTHRHRDLLSMAEIYSDDLAENVLEGST